MGPRIPTYLRFFDLLRHANFSAEMCSWADVGGVMGRSEPPAGGHPVPLYYSNPDIIYANEFPAPRFGQGCFAAALDAVYAAVSFSSFWMQNVCIMTAAHFACWSCVTLLLCLKIPVTSLSCSRINACSPSCSLMSAFGDGMMFSLENMSHFVLVLLSAAATPGNFRS